jgi:signal peptidase I
MKSITSRSIVATYALALVCMVALLVPPGSWPVTYVTVRGNSMEPEVASGDVLVLVSQSGYRTGQVVAYRVPEMGDAVILHRIVDRLDHPERYVLRGDNNDFEDLHQPMAAEILGRSVLHVSGATAAVLLSAGVRTTALVAFATVLVLSASARQRRRGRLRRRRHDRRDREWRAADAREITAVRP